MRINLVAPFAEKDAVKALGARWDPAKKLWYITDVADLTPFARWIPDLKSATKNIAPVALSRGPITTGSTTPVMHCGCNVLPWEDCQHTAAAQFQ
jgi:beta-lactamase regulating signal transducer with metallopeptidase domain